MKNVQWVNFISFLVEIYIYHVRSEMIFDSISGGNEIISVVVIKYYLIYEQRECTEIKFGRY